MKRCLKCNRQYPDETLRFCLDDGTPLSDVTREPAPATEIMPRGAPTQRSTVPTVPSYPGNQPRPATEEGRASNPILTGGVIAIALLLLVLVGIAGYFVLRQTGSSDSPGANATGTPVAKETPSPRTWTQPTPGAGEQTSTVDTQNGPLKITSSASSIRLAVQANTYYAANAMDGKRSTAWIEGVDGPGIGEWVRFDFDREINLHRILFLPGYFKSPSIWAQNNRLATLTAQFSDGSSRDLNFSDQMQSQKIDLGSVKTRWVRLVIKSVYYGSDPDTALSEIAFEWEP